MAKEPNEHKAATQSAPSQQAATPATNVTVVSTPSPLDAQTQVPVVRATTFASVQPAWPTVWPPTTPPPPKVSADSYVPWKEWQQVLATRSHVTDPPPCPVVISSY